MDTFYAFRPVESLDKIDPTKMAADKSYENALGDEGRKKLTQLSSEGYLTVESAIFAFDPKMSYAPPRFAAEDSFWAQKPTQMASIGTSGKSAVNKSAMKKKEKK